MKSSSGGSSKKKELETLDEALRRNADSIDTLQQKIKAIESAKKILSFSTESASISKANVELGKLKATLKAFQTITTGKKNLSSLMTMDTSSINDMQTKISLLEKYRTGMDITSSNGAKNNALILAQITKLKETIKALNSTTTASKTSKEVAGMSEESINQINVKLKEYKRLRDAVSVTKLHSDGGTEVDNYNKKIVALTEKVKKLKEIESKQTVVSISSLTNTSDLNTYAKREARLNAINKAIKNLDETDKHYNANLAKLVKTQQELNSKNSKYNGLVKTTQTNTKRLFSITQQLQRQLGFMFGVAALARYSKALIRTTGNFQLQHVALAAILKDGDKADLMFTKLQGLAIKSPFQFQQLATYTKQLAAFQFEAKDLYKTMKMLGDISAGVGVSMDRLILALGQVKAANYLRGTELRQFTEAGINILGLLADKYTELQGKAVTTADVMSMVSKRMVGYADVYSVLSKLTEDGGMFFNAQAIQAETLAGKLSNLQDNLDIMYNKLGTQSLGFVMPMLNGVITLTQNFRVLLPIVEGVTAAMFVMHLTSLKLSKSAIREAIGDEVKMNNLSRLERMYYRVNKAKLTAQASGNASIGMGAWGIAGITVGAVLAVVSAYRQLNLAYKESIEIFESIYNITDKQYEQLKETISKYKEIEEETKKKKENVEGLSSAEIISKQNGLEQDKLNILTEIETKYADINDRLNENLTIGERIKALEDINNMVSQLSVISIKNADYFDPIGSNTMAEEIDKLNERNLDVKKSTKELTTTFTILKNLLTQNWETTGLEQYKRSLDLLNKSEIDGSENTIRNLEIMQYIINDDDFVSKKIKDVTKSIKNLYKAEHIGSLGTNNFQFTEIGENLDDFVTLYKDEYKVAQQMFNSTDESTKKTVSNLGIAIESIIKQIKEDLDPAAKQMLKDFVAQKYNITIYADIESKDGNKKDPITGFRKRVNDYLAEHPLALNMFINAVDPKEFKDLKEFVDELGGGLQFSSMEDDRGKYYEELKKKIKSVEEEIFKLSTAEKDRFDNTANEKQLKMFKETLANLQLFRKLFFGNADDNKTTSTNKKLTERIALIKEAQDKYQKLLDVYNSDEATDIVRDSFKDAYIELDMDKLLKLDWTDVNVTEQFKMLITEGLNDAGKEGVRKINKEIAENNATITFNVRVEKVEEAKKRLEDLVDAYKLSTELENIEATGIDLQTMLGVDTVSLSDLKDSLDYVEKMMNSYGGKWKDVYKDMSDKIGDIESERLKKAATDYNTYLKTILGEAGQIAEKYKKEGETIDILVDMGKISKSEKDVYDYFANIKKSSELNKIEWDDMMNTPQMIDAFSNSERYITEGMGDMIKTLEEFKKNNSASMEFTDLRSLNSQIQELKDKLKDLKSLTWSGLIDKAKSDYKTLFGDWRGEAEKLKAEIKTIQDKKLSIETEIEITATQGKTIKEEIEEAVKSVSGEELYLDGFFEQFKKDFKTNFKDLSIDDMSAGLADASKSGNYTTSDLDLVKLYIEGQKTIIELKRKLAKANADLAQETKIASEVTTELTTKQTELVDLVNKVNKAIEGLGEGTKKIKEGVEGLKSIVDSVKQNMQDLRELQMAIGGESIIGQDDVSFVEDFSSALGFVINGFATIVIMIPLIQAGLASLGLTLATIAAPMAILVGIASAIGVVFALAKKHDRDLENSIQSLQSQVDDLTDSYDNLKDSLDRAFRLDNIRKYDKEMETNLKKQADDYKRMAAAEDAKKNTDQEKRDEYIKKAEEAQEKIVEQQIELMQRFGELDLSSAIDDFTSSFADAYYAGESTFDALEDKFNEFIQNVVNKQAATKIMGAFLDPMNKELDRALDDLSITPEEMASIQSLAMKAIGDSNTALQQFYESMGQVSGITDDTLSSLQKGIQGLTEETGEALEALMNAMRMDLYSTAQSTSRLQLIFSSNDSNVNPILNEIRNTNNLLGMIYSSINSVIASGHQKGGDGIKAFI